jgi:hypothetical protein
LENRQLQQQQQRQMRGSLYYTAFRSGCTVFEGETWAVREALKGLLAGSIPCS